MARDMLDSIVIEFSLCGWLHHVECVCVSMYLLHAEYQNLHSTIKDDIFLPTSKDCLRDLVLGFELGWGLVRTVRGWTSHYFCERTQTKSYKRVCVCSCVCITVPHARVCVCVFYRENYSKFPRLKGPSDRTTCNIIDFVALPCMLCSIIQWCFFLSFSLAAVHAKSIVAILHLLVALSQHFRAPIRLPDHVSIQVVVVQVGATRCWHVMDAPCSPTVALSFTTVFEFSRRERASSSPSKLKRKSRGTQSKHPRLYPSPCTRCPSSPRSSAPVLIPGEPQLIIFQFPSHLPD